MDLDEFLNKTVATSVQQQRFFHFTDVGNLASIREHGLLSTEELRRRGIFERIKPGGDEQSLISDAANGTDGYVCLCFTASHPMKFRAEQRGLNCVYLQVNPQVIKLPGVMITSAPSNQNGVVKVAAAQALDSLDLPVLYTRTDWNDAEVQARRQAAEKYEILVPRHVARDYIIAGL